MSGHHPPLNCNQVKQILKNLGFKKRDHKGTSHEQWVKTENNRLFKVTVDCPKQPFSHDLIRWMSSQAGITVKQFYEQLNK